MKNADRGKRRYIAPTLGALFLIVLSIWVLFQNLVGNYERNTAAESAGHLIEINRQIRLYIEEKIDSDWQAARSIAGVLAGSAYDEDELNALIRRERDIWGLADIMLYTKSGNGHSADGEISADTATLTLLNRVQTEGDQLSVLRSSMTYTLPLQTDATLDDSTLAALSMVRNLTSFLDQMSFASFGGSAFMYLTQENGMVISRLTHRDAQDIDSVLSLLDGATLECLLDEDHDENEIFTSKTATPYLLTDAGENYYLVSTPITAYRTNLRLFYIVPEDIVNHTAKAFSNYITGLSVMIILTFLVIALLVFLVFYRSRKARFDTQLIARDRMFDLLVRNTGTAFGLFSVDRAEPAYLTSNVREILGEQYIALGRENGRYRFTSASGAENEGIRLLNERAAMWDGARPFESGFIPRETPSGTRYYAIRMYGTEGSDKEFVGIAQDMTEDREREEALKTALRMADSASEAKTRFLSNMSHDIRTPMNAILNMTDFAIAADDPAARREYLQTIRDSSSHLLHLINDVLDMSRVESGKAVMLNEPFDMLECLRGVCDMVRPLTDQKQQRLIANIDQLKARYLTGDKLKVSQILINLLNNAVKFTPKRGRIRFSVTEMPSIRGDIASLRFTVTDNGIGIAPDILPHVFEPFMRGDENRVSGTEGTGLGLSICKSYVGAMGGTITCESEPGKGSAFTVEIPFLRARTQTPPVPEKAPPVRADYEGRRALLCEDNKINQMIAQKLLEQLGFKVDLATNGDEGVKMFANSENGCYDIIYMDIQMPVMNGYQATTAIRALPRPDAAAVPIVAMTANVFAEDVEKSRAAGMNGHIGKPVSVFEVAQVTARALQKSAE